MANILEEIAHRNSRSETKSMLLNLNNVLTVFDYFNTMNALKKLPQVKRVDLITLEQNNIQYRISFLGEKNKLLYSLDSSRYFLINKACASSARRGRGEAFHPPTSSHRHLCSPRNLV